MDFLHYSKYIFQIYNVSILPLAGPLLLTFPVIIPIKELLFFFKN